MLREVSFKKLFYCFSYDLYGIQAFRAAVHLVAAAEGYLTIDFIVDGVDRVAALGADDRQRFCAIVRKDLLHRELHLCIFQDVVQRSYL